MRGAYAVNLAKAAEYHLGRVSPGVAGRTVFSMVRKYLKV